MQAIRFDAIRFAMQHRVTCLCRLTIGSLYVSSNYKNFYCLFYAHCRFMDKLLHETTTYGADGGCFEKVYNVFLQPVGVMRIDNCA